MHPASQSANQSAQKCGGATADYNTAPINTARKLDTNEYDAHQVIGDWRGTGSPGPRGPRGQAPTTKTPSHDPGAPSPQATGRLPRPNRPTAGDSKGFFQGIQWVGYQGHVVCLFGLVWFGLVGFSFNASLEPLFGLVTQRRAQERARLAEDALAQNAFWTGRNIPRIFSAQPSAMP